MKQKLVEPTLEQILRHGNNRGIHYEPMSYGGIEDDSNGLMPEYFSKFAGGAAVAGLVAAASKVPHDRRTFLKLLGLGSALGASSCVTALVRPTIKHESQNFIYNLPDDLSKDAVAYIMEEHERGLTELEKRLRLEQDYGRKLGGKITVDANYNKPGAFSDLVIGTISYNRGVIGRGTMRTSSGPFIHEPTHHYTHSAGDFFSEGLAVYMQEQLGRNPASPNYGADLHRKIAGMELVPLSRFIGIQGLSRTLPESEVALAYLEAGSFVKYLIEDISKGDARQFMKFFIADRDYKNVFGKSFEELEQGWREKIKNTKPLYALSDALKVEYLNPRLQPSRDLDEDRKVIVRSYANSKPNSGPYWYMMWVDVKLESRAEDTIELVNLSIDDFYKGQKVDSANGYSVRLLPGGIKRRLKMLGSTLEPNEPPHTVPDFPLPIDSGWRGNEFVVHHIYKIPKISNEDMDAPVIVKRI